MEFKTLKEVNIKHKRVLVRVDFNAPIGKNGRITDDSRIKSSLPTIKYLLKNNAKIILITHLGRPDGRFVKELKLDNIATHLSRLLKTRVKKLDNCIGDDVESAVAAMKPKEIILLENIRFYAEEERNDIGFAHHLAALGQIYINDAFGVSHRSHASVDAITKFLPSAAGFLLEEEIRKTKAILDNPKKPFVVVFGGAKISDKMGLMKKLAKKADCIMLGGAMIFTFFKALDLEIGKSRVENDKVELAKKLLKESKNRLILPVDLTIADKISQSAKTENVPINKVPKEWIGLDIGPETAKLYTIILSKARTIAWNGSLGYCEIPKFAKSTNEIAKFIAKQTKSKKTKSVVGGGDTLAVLSKLKLEKGFTHVSTGGGASLELWEGKELPGIAALENAARRRYQL